MTETLLFPHPHNQNIRSQPGGHRNSQIAHPVTYSKSVNGRRQTMERERVRQDEDVNLSRVPVFVFPATVFFNTQDRDHLKQILTIYNPYEFPIRFKVLSTAPNLYTVIDPEGKIKSRNCVDLVLKVSSDVPVDATSPLEHKFRVQIYHQHDRKLLGRRDVPSIIHFGNLPPHLQASSDISQGTSSADAFLQCPPGTSTMRGSSSSRDHPIGSSNTGGSATGFLPPPQQANYVVIITALVCIFGLFLPTTNDNCTSGGESIAPSAQDTSSIIPTYLHLTVPQKLLCAYALGLVTMVVFRP